MMQPCPYSRRPDSAVPKSFSRGIQMYDLNEPLLSVGVLQQKSASI